MKLQDHKDRVIYAAVLSLIILACLELIGQLRSFFYDIWNILSAVIGPLVISVIITYVLRPLVDTMAERKVPRSIGILIIYAILASAIAMAMMSIVPMVSQQAATLLRQMPAYVGMFDSLLDHMSFAARVLPNGLRIGLEKAIASAQSGLVLWLSTALVGVKDLVTGFVSALVIPFLVFYMLKDYSLFTQLIVHIFRRSSRPTVERILEGMDDSLGRYVRGQLLVMLIVGAATFLGLIIVHMQNALLLSIIVGLTNIIPYVGPFIGAAPALFMALGISKVMLIKVLLVNLIVQQLEGNVFSPWIMGRTMNLHPLLILLGVMFAGEVGGIVGLIFAVPIIAVIKVIVEQVQRA